MSFLGLSGGKKCRLLITYIVVNNRVYIHAMWKEEEIPLLRDRRKEELAEMHYNYVQPWSRHDVLRISKLYVEATA